MRNKKSTNAEVVQRIKFMVDLILDGLSSHEILQYTSVEWGGLSDRQIFEYISRANEKIELMAEKYQEEAFNKIRARLERQYRRALQIKDGYLARLLLQDMRKLYALDKAPRAPIDEDGHAVPPELKQTINVLAILNQKHPDAFDAFVEVTTVPPGENGTAKKKTKRIQKPKRRKKS